MRRKTLSFILVFSIFVSLLTLAPARALAESDGTCGDDLTWNLSETGRLTIRGEGEMTSAPWLTAHKDDIKEVKIRSGVTSILKSAFERCTNLADVDIADTVTSIGGNAFYKCESLTSVYLPESVSSVGACAFGYCTNLAEINFPDGVTVIRDSMFFRCLSLKTVTLPDSVVDIEQLAFYACEELAELQLHEGLKTIGNEAFAFAAFTDLVIPESVESIAYTAFDYNANTCLNVYAGSYALEYAQKYNKPYVIIEREKTPAEKLCDLINAQDDASCEVDKKTQTVSLLSDVYLTQTVEMPEESHIRLDIKTFNIYGADDADAIRIPADNRLVVKGSGTIYGGNAKEGSWGRDAIYNAGVLVISGPTLQGGDAIDEYSMAGQGVGGGWETYLIEGEVIAGRGDYYGGIWFESLATTVLKESDDGINYTAVKRWTGTKRYIKGIKISDALSAPAKLGAILNEIEPGACTVSGNELRLNIDFTCPHEITIPTGAAIVFCFNRHTVTTFDFFAAFFIPEEAEITFRGAGVLTNKEKSPGHSSGIGPRASVLSNEGKLTIDGITVVGVGLSGIANGGELTIQSGKIMVSESSGGRDALCNDGVLVINGGEIIGGNATRDGGDGGDAINSMGVVVIPVGGTYPTTLNGGILRGGEGLGDGENGRAISTGFNIGKNSLAYESADGQNYSVLTGTRCDVQYLKIEQKTAGTMMSVQNVVCEEGEVNFDLFLFADAQISGTVYIAIYEGERLSHIKPYEAEAEIPVSVAYSNGQKIKVLWWGENLLPQSSPKEVPGS